MKTLDLWLNISIPYLPMFDMIEWGLWALDLSDEVEWSLEHTT